MVRRVVKWFSLAFPILLLDEKVMAQVGRVGKCPDMKAMPDLDFGKYLNGTWYEVAKFFTIVETKCVSVEFVPHNQTILVISNALEKTQLPTLTTTSPGTPPISQQSGKVARSAQKQLHQIKMALQRSNIASPQKRQITQEEPIYTPVKIVGFVAEKIRPSTLRFNYTEGSSMSEYRVLDTDYSHYAVIWSCNEMFNGVFHNQFVSVLSRSRKADPELIRSIVGKLTTSGIETAHIVAADQLRCDS